MRPHSVPSYVMFDKYVTCGPEHGMRPGTKVQVMPVNYILTEAGVGDYLYYAAALLWVARNQPWVQGKIHCCNYFVPFLRYFFTPYGWLVEGADDGNSLNAEIRFIGPNMRVEGQNILPQLLTPIHTHLMDLAFAYFCDRNVAPPDSYLPHLTFPPEKTHRKLRNLIGKYVVFTPGVMTPSRETSGRHWNPIIEHAVATGLMPVFLGRKIIAKGLQATFPDDIRYDLGLDLRNETTLLEAAAIMQHSRCVVGLDNGLLHLASCTPASVIFGYNIAGPEHRRPRRNWGRLLDITLTKKELSCAHCQSTMNLGGTHSYHNCLYWAKDAAGEFLPDQPVDCIELLFANSGQRWKDAIDAMS